MMAAVRCKVSKWVFILRTLLGRHWDENELFYSAEEVRCANICSDTAASSHLACVREAQLIAKLAHVCHVLGGTRTTIVHLQGP